MKRNKTRKLNPYILIVCEGTQTEKNYFKSFHVPALHIEVHGKGQSTINLVEYAQTLKTKGKMSWILNLTTFGVYLTGSVLSQQL